MTTQAVTTLVERMDSQHLQLSQQMASTESKILMSESKILMALGHKNERVYENHE